MALQKDEELVIDNSPEGDLLKISFNIRCVSAFETTACPA